VGRAAPRRSVTGVISCCGNCCGRGLWRREGGVHPGRGGLGTNRSLPIFATLRGIGWPGICGCANVQWVMGAGLFFSGPVHARRAAADGDSGSRSGSSWRTRMEDWLRGRFEGRGE